MKFAKGCEDTPTTDYAEKRNPLRDTRGTMQAVLPNTQIIVNPMLVCEKDWLSITRLNDVQHLLNFKRKGERRWDDRR